MKKLVLGLSLLSGLAFAQENQQTYAPKGEHCKECKCQHHKKGEKRHKGERVKTNFVENLQKDLNLSDKQVSQIKALHEKSKKEREKEMAQQKAKFEQKREAYKKEMKKILTADQFQKWEQKNEKRKEAFKKMREKRGQKKQYQNQ